MKRRYINDDKNGALPAVAQKLFAVVSSLIFSKEL